MSENKPLWIMVSTGQGNNRPWTKWIPDTPEARENALAEGYPWQSYYKYEYPPEAGKILPLMHGDIPIVFSYPVSELRYLALVSARIFIDKIQNLYGIHLEMFRVYMDTSGTVAVFIDSKIYGGDFPSVRLWLLHSRLLESICRNLPECKSMRLNHSCANIPYGLDFDRPLIWGIYRPIPTVFFLPPGIVSNGVYIVQLSPVELFERNPEDIWWEVCNDIKHQIPECNPEFIESMGESYERIAFSELSKPCLEKRISSLLKCKFGKVCLERQSKLKPEQIETAIALLTCLGKYGLEKSLELSDNFADRTPEWITAYFDKIYSMFGPPRCSHIKQNFDCGKNCQVDGPFYLPWNPEADVEKAKCYKEKEDGLYYSPSAWENDDDSIKLCSPLSIVALVKDVDELRWGKKVKYTSPNGNIHHFTVLMRDWGNNNDSLISKLLDRGIEIEEPKMDKLVKQYFRIAKPTRVITTVDRIGWQKKCYILPDGPIGDCEDEIEYNGQVGVFQTSGSYEDWVQHVGLYCKGNPLLIFVVCYAFTGPLLRMCNMESGGLNIHGASSTGKTTHADVAGSVWGGSPRRKYGMQCNATDNAMERRAWEFQDGLLIIDEIGQALRFVIQKLAYMLANGQGKIRLNPDTSSRETMDWMLSFLMTGEQKVSEKIKEDSQKNAMAGQLVRIIDLPVDNGRGECAFHNLHEFENPADFSCYLKEASQKYYGTAIRVFIKALCGADSSEHDRNAFWIKKFVDKFMNDNCPREANGQVSRVIRKFGLIAAAGVFAARNGVVPWNEEDSLSAVLDELEIWIANRGSLTTSQEVDDSIKNLKSYINKHSYDAFLDIDENNKNKVISSNRPIAGYRFNIKDQGVCIFLISETLADIISPRASRDELIAELDRRGYLAHNAKGKPLISKWVHDGNKRGLGFLPQKWQGSKSEDDEDDQASPVSNTKSATRTAGKELNDSNF